MASGGLQGCWSRIKYEAARWESVEGFGAIALNLCMSQQKVFHPLMSDVEDSRFAPPRSDEGT